VQSLFHSVQLNVNNPHFLIMQGRITKVLNMKPPEVLGLLEEAAGTKMYEDKKKKALATLEKKQVKVDEINKVRQAAGRGDGAAGGAVLLGGGCSVVCTCLDGCCGAACGSRAVQSVWREGCTALCASEAFLGGERRKCGAV
jgi:hypothetical protein